MTAELFQQLRAEVEKAPGLSEQTKAKLLRHVEAIERCANVANPDEAKAQSGLERLSSSIEELEVSHPDLTNIIGRIAVALGNMGI